MTGVQTCALPISFSKAPVQGAKAHADRLGFSVISEELYPLSTTDFAPFIDRVAENTPDIVFFCSYLNDSAGLIRAPKLHCSPLNRRG